nr:EF-hand domain pair [Tanacetum cinerariifolium]
MTWHATEKHTEPGKMQHPVDGRAWKNFDTKYPDFAKEPRNVRLGLAVDGFNRSKTLVSLIAYGRFMGKAGCRDYRRCYRLEVQYESDGLWTINDFPAQSSLSRWSGKGYKACPTCNEDTPSSVFSIGLRLVIRIDHQELKKVIWHVLHNSPEIDTYPVKFKSQFSNKDMKEEFPGWFGSQICQRHVDKDPSVSASSELFALACGPTLTPISVNSCVVNSVRFVVHSRDERRATQNNGMCSPGEDGEIYYGQLEEILEFSYMSFKTVLFRVKWFDTSNKGLVKRLFIRNNITQILANDGQSINVDAPLDIIDVDKDDDIIDDEDVLPHDLADSNNEDLVNVDDDDSVVVVYSSDKKD